MRLRSFGMIGVAAALAFGCGGAGSGAPGSFGSSSVPGNGNQPPNSSDVPGSSSMPSNPNQPLNNSSTPTFGRCDNLCALVNNYSCITIDPNSGMSCLSQCEVALANGTGDLTADCVAKELDAILCADAAGLLYCDQGNLSFHLQQNDTGGACATEIAAALQCERGSATCGPADTCDGCKCLNPTDPGACTDVCQQPNGGTCTMAGDQCAGCTPGCQQCLCLNNYDATLCTNSCP